MANKEHLKSSQLKPNDSESEKKQLQNKINELESKFKKINLNCVVPEVSAEEENYVVGYELIVNDKICMRVMRIQWRHIIFLDKRIQKYLNNPEIQFKESMERKYGWLRNSKKIFQIKCPNSVKVWLTFRKQHPHMFYGFRISKNTLTIEFLDETELREKYRSDYESVNIQRHDKNAKVCKNNIKKFLALSLDNEDDAVTRCLTRQDDAKEIFINAIKNIVTNPRGNMESN